MHSKFQFALIFIVSGCFLTSVAQKNIPWRIGVQYHHGFLYNHSESRARDKGVSLSSLNGAEVSFQWHTTGTKNWHHRWKYPYWGMSGILFVLPEKGYGGNCYAWLIYLGTHLVRTKHYELNLRLGTGIGTFESPYNPEFNPKNLWVSAPLNASMHLNLENRIRINDSVYFVFGGAFTHFSNGAVMMPNLGVNYPTLNIGFKMYPKFASRKFTTDTLAGNLPRWYAHVSASSGAKVLPDFGTTYYEVYNASLQVGYRLTGIYKPIVGVDAFRDASLLADSTVRTSGTDINRYGVFVGNEFLMGNLGMYFGMGRYVYKKTLRDADFYIRVGLRLHVYRNIFAGVALKTHWGQADSFEWSLGYTFK